MTVYVDNARLPFRRMIMCHMVADSVDELHEMADAIGVNRRWFQSEASYPHYDVCLSRAGDHSRGRRGPDERADPGSAADA